MAIILSIETSAPLCSVAVHKEGVLMGCNEVTVFNSHSEVLTSLIESLLINLNLGMNDLDAVCVGKGPGSYTGLRISTSTAKGLCYSLDIPLIAIDTLEGMYNQVQYVLNNSHFLYCPMLDARRMEVYHALYKNDGTIVQATSPLIFEGDSLIAYASENIVYFGDGAFKGQDFMRKYPQAKFIEGITTSARGLGKSAHDKFIKGAFEDVAYFEPFYLKEVRITIPKNKNV